MNIYFMCIIFYNRPCPYAQGTWQSLTPVPGSSVKEG